MIRVPHVRILAALVLVHWANFSIAAIDDGSRAAARELVNTGAKEFKVGHFEAALAKFNDALAIAEVPTVAVWAAQANERLGKLLAAQRLYTSALLMSKNELWIGTTQQEAQQKARKALQELEPRIPKLTIGLEGAGASTELEIVIDDEKIKNEALRAEFPIDPGEHQIAAKQGARSAKVKVTCTEGKKCAATLKLADSDRSGVSVASVASSGEGRGMVAERNQSARSGLVSRDQSSGEHSNSAGQGQRTVGWIVTGAGAAGVVIGIATGIAVGVKRSSMQGDGCLGNDCVGPAFKDRVDSYNALRTVSGVSLIAGGVVAAAGVTLLLTSPKQEAGATIGLAIHPGHVGLVGSY